MYCSSQKKIAIEQILAINLSILENRVPRVFASLLTAGILRPAPGYSNIRKALIAPYDIGKFLEVSANPQCILIIVSAAAPFICKSTNKRCNKQSVSNCCIKCNTYLHQTKTDRSIKDEVVKHLLSTPASSDRKKLKTINPSTEEILNEYELISKEQLNDIVDKSKKAFLGWKEDIDKRADFLYAFAKHLRKNKENLAKTATQEMGKVIKESRSEVEKCAWTAEYFADNGKILVNDEVVNTDARKSIVSFQPLGVIGSIMPWNFPYWQGLRFAAPALMVGNTIILKPASATMQCGIEIEKTFDKAGVPHGVFQTLVGDSSIAETLIDSHGVNAVTFTGSVPVGARVAERATSQIKKTVLELGGSDPFIVCEDADIEKASTGAVKGRFINCGQSCIASKRFIVTKKVANEFIEKFVQKTERLKVGDPLSDETEIGPVVNIKSLENMEGIVNRTLKEGAELITGGKRMKDKGYFYSPTIFRNVSPHMEITQEEVFGPVAPVITVEDEKEAIRIANDSKFGLGASIWTQDLDKAEALSSIVQSGIVTVNNVVVSDPRVPFGGIKNSGFGRELSRFGMLEFVNIKSVRFYDQLIYEHHVE